MLTVLRRFSILMTMIGELYFLGTRPTVAVQFSVYTMIAGKLNQVACLPHSVQWKLEKENVTGGWRRLHDEEYHNSSSSPNIIMLIKLRRMGGACGTHGRGDKCMQNFSWNIKSRGHFWRYRPQWEDNMGIKERGLKFVDYIHLAQDYCHTMPFKMVDRYYCFRETCYLHLQGRRLYWALRKWYIQEGGPEVAHSSLNYWQYYWINHK